MRIPKPCEDCQEAIIGDAVWCNALEMRIAKINGLCHHRRKVEEIPSVEVRE